MTMSGRNSSMAEDRASAGIVVHARDEKLLVSVFNVGNYRRVYSDRPPASFFDSNNPQGNKVREEAARAAVSDTLNYLQNRGGLVAVLDGTNSTLKRRDWLCKVAEANGHRVLFVENICNSEDVIMQNIIDVKLSSPDYEGQDAEKAALDFRERIRHYERSYEPIGEDECTYVKLLEIGTQVIINRIEDFLQSRIVYYLMNLHVKPRSVWLSRHGESEYNLIGRIGGDSSLSHRGKDYAHRLPQLIRKSVGDAPLTVWTSTLRRTIETAANLSYPKLEWKALDELDAGVCDGLTYEEIEMTYPEDYACRDQDKFNYRYRGGESYHDVVIRLEPVIMELERRENVLVIGHQAVIRCIYAYYMNLPQDESPWIDIPLHTVMRLTPAAYKTHEERLQVDVPAVTTHRVKPVEING